MEILFTANESLEMEIVETTRPIQHYLRQPQRLVKAISDKSLMQELSESRYSVATRPLNFMDIYYFQPTVILRVVADPNGSVYLRSEGCQIKGIDYINDRFKLSLVGKLAPVQREGKTYLEGRADLEVKIELPPPLWLTPKPLLELTGNSLLKSVLNRIKQRLQGHLIKDYQEWANDETPENESIQSRTILGEI